jgi:hypothetical protein
VSAIQFLRCCRPSATKVDARGPRISVISVDEEKKTSRPSTSDHKSDFELVALPKKRAEADRTYEQADEIVQTTTNTFMWRNLQYDVPAGPGASRRLLSSVSGYAAPGKLTALMGAERVNIHLPTSAFVRVRLTRCGVIQKTLFNVLAGRDSTGVISGELLVNGEILPTKFRMYKYVPIVILFREMTLTKVQWILPTDGCPSSNDDCIRGSLVFGEASSASVDAIGQEESTVSCALYLRFFQRCC